MQNGKRRLAAIMFTDIVGYSALSHRSESIALELLEEHILIIRPVLAEFSGREIKTIGDAFLVEFTSVLEAVHCGIRIQKLFRERNALEESTRQINLRVGIHLGDVVADSDGDVYGDGVNIAARLLHRCSPGGVCVSQHVYHQIDNKLSHDFHDLGTQPLKNISKRIKVYGISIEASQSPSTRRRLRFSHARVAFAAGAVLSVIVGALPAWKYALNHARTGTHAQAAAIAQTAPAGQRVAVLPFSNLSAASDDEYLSEGMTEELISNLSRNPTLHVLARSSVMAYRETQKTPSQIGHELGASLLVTGSVRHEGGRVRISAQLTDSSTQENLWSQEFEGTTAEIFEIQKNIASRVSSRFHTRSIASIATIGPAEPARSPNQAAYIEFLKGRYFMNRRTEEGLLKGAEHLTAATRLDATFAPAFAGLANVYGLLSYYGHLPPAAATKLGMKYVEQALALDPSSAEALISLAEKQAYYDRDWAAAEQSFKQAIQARWSYPIAHQWYAEFLSARNRIDEARAEVKIALDLDPLSLPTNTCAGLPEYFSRHYDEAVKKYQATIEMDPHFAIPYYWMGRAYTDAGKYDEAFKALNQAISMSESTPMVKSALAYAWARAGKKTEARQAMAELETLSQFKYVNPYDLARIAIALGDRAQAFTYLRKAAEERSSHVAYLKVDPSFDSIRSAPEYAALLTELNLN